MPLLSFICGAKQATKPITLGSCSKRDQDLIREQLEKHVENAALSALKERAKEESGEKLPEGWKLPTYIKQTVRSECFQKCIVEEISKRFIASHQDMEIGQMKDLSKKKGKQWKAVFKELQKGVPEARELQALTFLTLLGNAFSH